MIGYIMVGTNQIEKAVKFYDELFADLGIGRFMEEDNFVAWGAADSPGFCVTKPYDGNSATVGNGSMAAFIVESKDQVDSLHKKALSLGGADEGARFKRRQFLWGVFSRSGWQQIEFLLHGLNSLVTDKEH